MPYKNPQDKKDYDKKNWRRRYESWAGRIGQLAASAKRRARVKALEFHITPGHLCHCLETQGYRCAATGREFDLSPVTQHKNPWSPSLDRINPHKGYTWENTRVIATIVNEAKGQHRNEDLLLMARLLLNPLQEI